MKTLIYSAKDFEIPYLEEANKETHDLTFIKDSLSSQSAIKAEGFEAISIFSADEACFLTIEKLKGFGVKYITLRSVGHDNVNLRAASRVGIKVANVPAYSPYAIAEHATSLLLTLNRRIIESNKRVKQFNFDLNNLIGFDLNNKTIGIIGTGRIGAVMTKIMSGFGCHILGYDINENEELTEEYNMKYVPLKTLCQQADVISIHVPYSAETHYLIDEDLIEDMKPGILIINTARGAILNTEAIINGMKKGIIAGLGIDVYENEENIFFKDHSQDIPGDDLFIKLNALPNVLITGHHAFLTHEALTQIAEITMYNLNCWSEGQATVNELTNADDVI